MIPHPTSDHASGFVVSVLSWTAASAGLTGLLIAVGYVVASAHSEFLGIAVAGLGPAEYVRLAGGFTLAVVLHLASLAADVWEMVAARWLSVGAAIVGGVVLARVLRGVAGRALAGARGIVAARMRPTAVPLAAIVLILTVAKVAYFDVPAFDMRGVLLHTIACPGIDAQDVVVPGRTVRLWRDVVCSRGAAASCGCDDKESHANRLRREFALGISASSALVGAAFVVLLQTRMRSAGRFDGAAAFLGLAMTGVVAINIVLMPYSYGKILHPTIFGKGDVALEGDGQPLKAYVLVVSEESVTLFTEEKAVVTVPKARVHEIRLVSIEDVLLTRLGIPPAAQSPR